MGNAKKIIKNRIKRSLSKIYRKLFDKQKNSCFKWKYNVDYDEYRNGLAIRKYIKYNTLPNND